MTESTWSSPAESLGELAVRLRAERGGRAVSDVATLIYVHRQNLYRWEAGTRLMSAGAARALDQVFGTGSGIQQSVQYLRERRGEARRTATAQHTWEAAYEGEVWFVVEVAKPGVRYALILQWGPWRYEGIVAAKQNRLIFVTGKDADPGRPQTMFVRLTPGLSITFGEGMLPSGQLCDLRRLWDWASGSLPPSPS